MRCSLYPTLDADSANVIIAFRKLVRDSQCPTRSTTALTAFMTWRWSGPSLSPTTVPPIHIQPPRTLWEQLPQPIRQWAWLLLGLLVLTLVGAGAGVRVTSLQDWQERKAVREASPSAQAAQVA